MAFGMSFTLAFLPVGLIVALAVIGNTSASLKMRALLILAIGAGFFALLAAGWLLSGANPFVIGVLESEASRRVLRRIPAKLLEVALG